MSDLNSSPFLTPEQIEDKLNRFLGVQSLVFEHHKFIIDWCISSIEGERDQASYDLSKRILKDVDSFERLFDEFEVEFWNYIQDVHGGRAYVDSVVVERGISDHKEYFFSKISDCISTLSEVVTELKANGYEWEVLSDLEDSLESLFDVSEELIEVDISQLASVTVSDLLQTVPPQRIAPLEVFSAGDCIRKRTDRHTDTNVGSVAIGHAMAALEDIIQDTVIELSSSNCDPRILRSVEKCLSEIKKEFDIFSPIRFGIFVGVAEGFKEEVEAEFNNYLSRQFSATLLQCSVFLRNFRAWLSYSEQEGQSNVEDGTLLIAAFQAVVDDILFDNGVRDAVAELRSDKREFSSRKSLDYSIFQSVSNVLSEVCRLSIRHVAGMTKSSIAVVAESGRDLVKASVSILAVGWLVRNSDYLLALSDRYQFFSWIKPVVEFIKNNFAG